MSRRHLLRLGAVLSGLALTGCAPSLGPGLQIGVGVGPGMHLTASSCSLAGAPLQTTLSGPARMLDFAKQQIRAAQAKASLATPTAQERMESWKRLGSGGC